MQVMVTSTCESPCAAETAAQASDPEVSTMRSPSASSKRSPAQPRLLGRRLRRTV
jgi:hypothetical protein